MLGLLPVSLTFIGKLTKGNSFWQIVWMWKCLRRLA